MFYAPCIGVKDHRDLLNCLSRLKKTCVRQVVLDKWLPLIINMIRMRIIIILIMIIIPLIVTILNVTMQPHYKSSPTNNDNISNYKSIPTNP